MQRESLESPSQYFGGVEYGQHDVVTRSHGMRATSTFTTARLSCTGLQQSGSALPNSLTMRTSASFEVLVPGGGSNPHSEPLRVFRRLSGLSQAALGN